MRRNSALCIACAVAFMCVLIFLFVLRVCWIEGVVVGRKRNMRAAVYVNFFCGIVVLSHTLFAAFVDQQTYICMDAIV